MDERLLFRKLKTTSCSFGHTAQQDEVVQRSKRWPNGHAGSISYTNCQQAPWWRR
jgi:hypothetical protein